MPANGGGHSSVCGLMGFDGSQDGVRDSPRVFGGYGYWQRHTYGSASSCDRCGLSEESAP